jgi:hypothetical protein
MASDTQPDIPCLLHFSKSEYTSSDTTKDYMIGLVASLVLANESAAILASDIILINAVALIRPAFIELLDAPTVRVSGSGQGNHPLGVGTHLQLLDIDLGKR